MNPSESNTPTPHQDTSTPRTDDEIYLGDDIAKWCPDFDYVSAKFARTLETELVSAQSALAERQERVKELEEANKDYEILFDANWLEAIRAVNGNLEMGKDRHIPYLNGKMKIAENEAVDLRAQLAAECEGADQLADHLRWVLPMAKGYAHAHPVGNNWPIIAKADEAAETHRARRGKNEPPEINEADDLRREDREAKSKAHFDQMDQRDQSGPHYPWR